MRKRLELSVQAAVTEGGGSEMLILESNQDHATIKDGEVCPCLPASSGILTKGEGLQGCDRLNNRR